MSIAHPSVWQTNEPAQKPTQIAITNAREWRSRKNRQRSSPYCQPGDGSKLIHFSQALEKDSRQSASDYQCDHNKRDSPHSGLVCGSKKTCACYQHDCICQQPAAALGKYQSNTG